MAAKGVNMINELYAIECSFDGMSLEEKHKQRQERLKPAFDVFFAWLEALHKILCKSKSNQAKDSLRVKHGLGFPLNCHTPAG